MKKLVRRSVFSARNSFTGSGVPLSDLQQDNWWTDTSFDQMYLHVRDARNDTTQRVYCRGARCPRLEMRDGKLMWLFEIEP